MDSLPKFRAHAVGRSLLTATASWQPLSISETPIFLVHTLHALPDLLCKSQRTHGGRIYVPAKVHFLFRLPVAPPCLPLMVIIIPRACSSNRSRFLSGCIHSPPRRGGVARQLNKKLARRGGQFGEVVGSSAIFIAFRRMTSVRIRSASSDVKCRFPPTMFSKSIRCHREHMRPAGE